MSLHLLLPPSKSNTGGVLLGHPQFQTEWPLKLSREGGANVCPDHILYTVVHTVSPPPHCSCFYDFTDILWLYPFVLSLPTFMADSFPSILCSHIIS